MPESKQLRVDFGGMGLPTYNQPVKDLDEAVQVLVAISRFTLSINADDDSLFSVTWGRVERMEDGEWEEVEEEEYREIEESIWEFIHENEDV